MAEELRSGVSGVPGLLIDGTGPDSEFFGSYSHSGLQAGIVKSPSFHVRQILLARKQSPPAKRVGGWGVAGEFLESLRQILNHFRRNIFAMSRIDKSKEHQV